MTLPYPPHVALLGETDVQLKSLAYATDAKLAGYTQMYVTTGTSSTDINGDIVVDFHTAKTLIGAIVQPTGFVLADGAQRNFPPPNASDTIPRTFVSLHPRQFLANGLLWVKVMTCPVHYTGTANRFYGSQPAASGTSVPYVAFGWA
jgi:hypothetical protein